MRRPHARSMETPLASTRLCGLLHPQQHLPTYLLRSHMCASAGAKGVRDGSAARCCGLRRTAAPLWFAARRTMSVFTVLRKLSNLFSKLALSPAPSVYATYVSSGGVTQVGIAASERWLPNRQVQKSRHLPVPTDFAKHTLDRELGVWRQNEQQACRHLRRRERAHCFCARLQLTHNQATIDIQTCFEASYPVCVRMWPGAALRRDRTRYPGPREERELCALEATGSRH